MTATDAPGTGTGSGDGTGAGDAAPTAAPERPRRTIRARWIIAAVVCIGAVVWMITSLSTNLDYWKPVDQAVRDRAHDSGKHLRIGGIVVPHSLQGRQFQLSDGKATMLVQLGSANAPETIKDYTPLVVGGRWQGQVLLADELTRRHGSEYSSMSHPLADDTPVSSCRSSLGS